MEALGKITLSVIGAICSGIFLKLAWSWFFVPLGIPDLKGYAHAFGVAVLVGYLTKNTNYKDNREEAEKIAAAVLYPAIALLFAWIYKLCM